MIPMKKEALDAISSLPDNAELDDIMYRLYVIDKIKKGQSAAKNGEVVSVDVLKEEMAGW